MAFDGITIRAIVSELNDHLISGRIYKIAQPESDELLLTIKNGSDTFRLQISANPSLPLVCLFDDNKQSPMTAPNFCMLLRKHIQNGRIVSISQPSLERIIRIDIEHLDEMGDLRQKKLMIELMGKHSNIIFVDENNVIIDAIKHIGPGISSVREVLPGREYFIPESLKRSDPLNTSFEEFSLKIDPQNAEPAKEILKIYCGISPFIAESIVSSSDFISSRDIKALYDVFSAVMKKVAENDFDPKVLYENGIPFEYSFVLPGSCGFKDFKEYSSVSTLLIDYYRDKEIRSRILQKSSDLRRIVSQLLEKEIKKYDIHKKQLEDPDKKDRFRVWGELLNTYGYNAKPGDRSIEVENYYTGKSEVITLDPDLSATDNAKKYFERYNKLKRTEEAAKTLLDEAAGEIEYLETIQNAIDIALTEDDLLQIKSELTECGYIKKHSSSKKKERFVSKPLHYVTKEGFHIYVGKNNIQNEDITFNLANGNDWWFHAKKIPGSHVIVKTEGRELPDSVFEDAARLAAHYSKAKGNSKIEVDYVRRKEVKHPNGSKPGFVVYYTNYSMLIDSDISSLTLLSDK
ncbi:MAG: NFACT family protein [Lachnospiraceae bacterium]|nr:NFACT family protein [Lachnospiraceae bacterium]